MRRGKYIPGGNFKSYEDWVFYDYSNKYEKEHSLKLGNITLSVDELYPLLEDYFDDRQEFDRFMRKVFPGDLDKVTFELASLAMHLRENRKECQKINEKLVALYRQKKK